MNLKNLEVGMKLKYKDLCEIVGEKTKSGNLKYKQLLTWESYFIWENDIIQEIFDISNPVIDIDYIQILILRILKNKISPVDINNKSLLHELEKVRKNYDLYIYYKYNENILTENFTSFTNHFDNTWHKGLEIMLESAYKQLANRCLINYQVVRNCDSNMVNVAFCPKYINEGIDSTINKKGFIRKPSLGEKFIEEWLWNNKVNYISEYMFKDSNHKEINNKRYDFAVIVDNKVKLLIEYDGIQHEKPIGAFGGEEAFNKLKINDETKNEYCKIKGYKLIRIKSIDDMPNNKWKLWGELDKRVLPLI